MTKYFQTWMHLVESSQETNIQASNQRLALLTLRQDIEQTPIGISSNYFTITRNFMRAVKI